MDENKLKSIQGHVIWPRKDIHFLRRHLFLWKLSQPKADCRSQQHCLPVETGTPINI